MSTLMEDAAAVRRRELEVRLAKAMADEIGHGDAVRCMAYARVAVRAMGEGMVLAGQGDAVAWLRKVNQVSWNGCPDCDPEQVSRLVACSPDDDGAFPVCAMAPVAWPEHWVDQHVYPKALHKPVLVPLEVLIRTKFELTHSERGGDYDTKILGILRDIIAMADSMGAIASQEVGHG